jgi:hypothetical protein
MRSDITCVMRRHRRQFNASVGASGPHGFAVRERALRPAHSRVHRIPRPTLVTIAKRPSCGGHGTAQDIELILADDEAEYFREQDWTRQLRQEPVGQINRGQAFSVKALSPCIA